MGCSGAGFEASGKGRGKGGTRSHLDIDDFKWLMEWLIGMRVKQTSATTETVRLRFVIAWRSCKLRSEGVQTENRRIQERRAHRDNRDNRDNPERID
jgi:hypothetical protein